MWPKHMELAWRACGPHNLDLQAWLVELNPIFQITIVSSAEKVGVRRRPLLEVDVGVARHFVPTWTLGA